MEKKLAIFGGKPVRESILQYGKQSIDQTDVDAVVDVLNSAWLTTGPYVENFEKSVAQYTQANNAISVSSGTAALHTALAALDLCENDEVIVPSITFLATANSVVFVGAKPVFADVYADTLLIDPNSVETLISDRTKAIICVDFAGQCCDYDAINKIANKQGIKVIADACHSLGAKRDGVSVGKLADISVLSFHPVKNITTAEGGMLLTNDDSIAHKARLFRNHGMDRDHNARSKNQSWRYSMFEIGYNYRLSDLHAALGASQLKRLPAFNKRRLEIAKQYDYALQNIEYVTPVKRDGLNEHVYHLYVIRLDTKKLKTSRDEFFSALRAENIGVNVHYFPVHLQPYYKKNFDTCEGMCPVSEEVYNEIISLPIYPDMTEGDIEDVVLALKKVVAHYHSCHS